MALVAKRQLQELYLGDNHLGDRGAELVVAALGTALQKLDLRENQVRL